MIVRSSAALCAVILFLGCPGPALPDAGGTTGGGSSADAGCAATGGSAEGAPCAVAGNCACPLHCGGDPALNGTVCQAPCTATLNCDDARKACVRGLCLLDVCADGGPFDEPCGDAGDLGTCLPSQVPGGALGICVGAGASDGGCDLNPSRADPAKLCAQGFACLNFGGSGLCAPACDPTLGAGDGGSGLCGPSAECISPTGVGQLGGCIPLGPGGCLTESPRATELDLCTQNDQCTCPEHCIADSASGASLCERACTATSECPTATTVCTDGACAPAYCAVDPLGDSLDGGFGESCNAASIGDGICVPLPSSESNPGGGPAFVYGLCEQSGSDSLGEACDTLAGRGSPTLLCSPGSVCAMVFERTGDFCAAVCQPELVDAGCGAGQGCFALYRGMYPLLAPSFGLCRPCATDGGCFANGECCSGVCIDGGLGGTCG